MMPSGTLHALWFTEITEHIRATSLGTSLIRRRRTVETVPKMSSFRVATQELSGHDCVILPLTL